MKNAKNRLLLDYKDLPDLKAGLGGLAAGDTFDVTFKLTVVDNAEDHVESNIDEVEYSVPNSDSGEADTGETEPSSDEPVMAVVVKRNAKDAKKKSPLPASDPAEEEGE